MILSFVKRGLTPRPGYAFWRADYWFGRLDSRPLSVFRIALALLLIKDAVYDLTLARDFYSNQGIVPLSALADGLARGLRFSLMDAMPYAWMATVFFLLWIAVLVMLLVGYRTRLMSILNVIIILSIHERNLYILSGADTVFRTLSIWSAFLPLGHYYSVDALRERIARYRLSRAPADLRATDQPQTAWALPVRMIQLQVVLVYLFTGTLKIIQPSTWRTGQALYYTFQLHTLTLPTGDWLGANAPMWILGIMDYQTLITELGFAFFVLSPFFQPLLRKIGLTLGFILHFGIAVTMAIGNFSMVMISSYLVFFEAGWIEWLDNRLRALRPTELPSQLGVPPRGSPLWLLVAATRDDQVRLAWDVPTGDSSFDGWKVQDEHNHSLAGAAAWQRAAGHLPLSRVWARFLQITLLRRSAWAGLHAISARWLTPTPDPEAEPEPQAAAPSKTGYRVRLAAKGVMAAALGVTFGLIVWWNLSGIQLGNRHPFPPVPHPASDLVLYSGLWQSWDMFSPFPQTFDGWIVIPGRFEDGKTFDLRTNQPVSDVMPRTYIGTVDRWKKFEDNLAGSPLTQLLSGWGSMYCHLYNDEIDLPDGHRLATLEIHYKRIDSHAAGQPANPLKDVLLWRQWCYPQYRY
jgi:HTTM domain